MATLRDIKRRIKAVTSTRQITKAMKMVSASKLKRVQGRMLEMRPYASKMDEVIKSLAAGADKESSPLLIERPRKNVEVLVLTSDRGLCSAFNTNVMKLATKVVAEFRAQGVENVHISSVGKKAADFYRRRGIKLKNSWTGFSGHVSYENAKRVATAMIEGYVSGEVDEVVVIYNKFKNVVQQIPTSVKFLPASIEAGDAPDEGGDFIYEPAEDVLLEFLLPKNTEIQVFSARLESQTSEEAARMAAMENATKSSTEMIDKLSLKYNKARQAGITADLMDIVGGVEALKQ
jgi:F-type H+-transporting ATPase subunit gamma